MRVLVDTNVFLDFLLKRPPFFEDAKAFFSYFPKHHHQMVVSPMTFRDIEYVLRKIEPDPEERRRVLRSIYGIVFKIIDLGPDDVINNLFADHKDFEGGLIMESAERNMLDGIVTNNVDDFVGSKVPVFSPKKLVEYLAANS